MGYLRVVTAVVYSIAEKRESIISGVVILLPVVHDSAQISSVEIDMPIIQIELNSLRLVISEIALVSDLMHFIIDRTV